MEHSQTISDFEPLVDGGLHSDKSGAIIKDNFTALILRFLNRLKRNARSPNTIAAYRNDLGLFAKFCKTSGVTLEAFHTGLHQDWNFFLESQGRHSAASLRRAHMSVRSFLNFLVEMKVIQGSVLLQTPSPRQPSNKLLAIPSKQFELLVSKLQKLATLSEQDSKNAEVYKNVRDLTLVLALGECGFKASEISKITWSHFLGAQNEHTSSNQISGGFVRIPGSKDRIVPVSKRFCETLAKLRIVRESLGLSNSSQALVFFGFLNLTKHVGKQELKRHGVKFVVYEICETHLKRIYNSESFRNRAILQWLGCGIGVDKVCELAGYANASSLLRFGNEKKSESSRQKKQ